MLSLLVACALLWLPPEHLARDAHAARHRQRDIEDEYVRLRTLEDRVGILRLLRLADELHVWLRREKGSQPFPEQPMVINHDESDGGHVRISVRLYRNVRYGEPACMRTTTD